MKLACERSGMRALLAYCTAMCTIASCDSSLSTADDYGESERELQLEESLRIGGLDGTEEYTFGFVSTLAPASDGSVYVADAQIPVVRRYDAQGRFMANIGRSGEGPGEYRSLDGLAGLTNGRLAVWDARLRRATLFNAEGTYEESIPLPSGLGAWRGFVWSPGGDLFVRTRAEGPTLDGSGEVPSRWSRVTPDTDPEALHNVPAEDRDGPRYVLSGRGGYYRPFVTMTLSTIGPNGAFYYVRNDEYAIHHIHPDGTETAIHRDEPRVRLRAEEKAEWESRSEMFARRSPDRRPEFFPIPDLKPLIRELVVDLEGRLWVSRYTEAVFMEYSEAEAADARQRNVPPYQWRDSPRWDIYSADDRFIGSATFPFRTSFITAVGDMVWGIQAGEYLEDYVVRWKLDGLLSLANDR